MSNKHTIETIGLSGVLSLSSQHAAVQLYNDLVEKKLELEKKKYKLLGLSDSDLAEIYREFGPEGLPGAGKNKAINFASFFESCSSLISSINALQSVVDALTSLALGGTCSPACNPEDVLSVLKRHGQNAIQRL
jgi:hypothetical protein